MHDNLKQKLSNLAETYEISSFVNEDPSQFIRWYSSPIDIEPACFIAAMLSFGSRKQFIPKIKSIFELADKAGGMAEWLKSSAYKEYFNSSEKKFYRFYSYDDMGALFEALRQILIEYSTFGDAVKKNMEQNATIASEKNPVIDDAGIHINFNTIQPFFIKYFDKSAIVPKGKTSANKRIHMFLRWMVRQNSPVDIGLWSWYPQSELIIPLDVHVMKESIKMGLIPQNATASLKTAKALTQELKQIWPEDPCKGDFALFGLGIEKN